MTCDVRDIAINIVNCCNVTSHNTDVTLTVPNYFLSVQCWYILTYLYKEIGRYINRSKETYLSTDETFELQLALRCAQKVSGFDRDVVKFTKLRLLQSELNTRPEERS